MTAARPEDYCNRFLPAFDLQHSDSSVSGSKSTTSDNYSGYEPFCAGAMDNGSHKHWPPSGEEAADDMGLGLLNPTPFSKAAVRIMDQNNDFSLEIPEGAIPGGESLAIETGVALSSSRMVSDLCLPCSGSVFVTSQTFTSQSQSE